ncbi:MAG: hypothetical protein IPJ41_01380 [Phycisphaerales bacterium]|nr:hypothetical protein [Phycisphaerales bacterium]
MKDSVKAVVAVVLLVAAGLIVMFFLRARSTGDVAYYYDVSEKKLYAAKAAQVPPLPGVGGESGDGVVAVVVVCGGKTSERKIAYLMTYSPELASAMKQAEASRNGQGAYPEQLNDRAWVGTNTLVRREDDPSWHAMSSSEGQAALAVLNAKCEDGSYPRVCSPAD